MASCFSVEAEKRPKEDSSLSRASCPANTAVRGAVLGPGACVGGKSSTFLPRHQAKGKSPGQVTCACAPYPLRLQEITKKLSGREESKLGLSGETMQWLGLGQGDSVQPAQG